MITNIFKNVSKENRKLSEYLDRKSVCRELNISETTFTNYVNTKNLPKIKVNRRVFVKREDLNNWLDSYK